MHAKRREIFKATPMVSSLFSLSGDHEREEYSSSHEDGMIARKSICVKTPRLTEL